MYDDKITGEGDLVLVHYQEKPAVYARLEAVNPDIKKDWYQVALLLLTIPAQPVTWILREEYINGVSFTMGGQSMRLEKVERVVRQVTSEEENKKDGEKRAGNAAKVIPLKKQPR